ncbi:MAG: hypothetical protein HC822_13475 [Oscillochloris sp.]|nr:hypothetical protein [Oscillochloris sp.]
MESNPELQHIYEQDQADRRGPVHPEIWARDQTRRVRVEAMLSGGAVRSAADCLHAAFIFQHGDRLEHYWQAHELALQAVDRGHGPPARWLAAAAYDRWLMHQGLPQKFGTQYRMHGAEYLLHEVDPTTSDEERIRWDVAPLAEAQAFAQELTRRANEDLRRQEAQSGDSLELLALLDVPGLRVAQVAVRGEEAMFVPGAMPAPEILEAGPHPLPAYLPPGLALRRLGQGYCAVDAQERFQVTWIEVLLPPGETLHLVWNTDEGAAPNLEAARPRRAGGSFHRRRLERRQSRAPAAAGVTGRPRYLLVGERAT